MHTTFPSQIQILDHHQFKIKLFYQIQDGPKTKNSRKIIFSNIATAYKMDVITTMAVKSNMAPKYKKN